MLKVTYVLGYFPAISETFIVNQINASIDRGHEVKIYSYRKGSAKNIHDSHLRHNLIDGTTYFIKKPKSIFKRYTGLLQFIFKQGGKLNWSLLFKSLNFLADGRNAITLNLFYEAQWFLDNKQHDIIHAHFGHNSQRIARLKSYGFIPSVKLITTFHGFDLAPNSNSLYQERYNSLLKYGNWYTVNTKYLENILSSLIPSEVPISIIPVGLDTQFFQSNLELEKHSKFSIIFCGRLIKLKGAHLAIQVVNLLKERGYEDVNLRIIGTGSEFDFLQKLSADLDLEESVQFLGACTQEEVKREMQQAHVFLLPGMYDPETGRAETQGLVIQEAQSMGLPVVVSDAGGMKYGLLDGVTGHVIKAGNTKGFADVIETIMNNDSMRITMGEEARKYVVQNYDSQYLNEELTTIYKKLLLS